MENVTAKTKDTRYFVHNFSTWFPLTASLATGTQDLSISKTVQNRVQMGSNNIPFAFEDSFERLLQTLQASTDVKRSLFV